MIRSSGAELVRRSLSTRVAVLALGAVLSGATGCGADSGTGPAPSPYGLYVLHQVDERNLPAQIHEGPWVDQPWGTYYDNFVVSVSQGSIELDEDGYFALSVDYDIVGDGRPWSRGVVVEGSYELDGADVWVTPNGNTNVAPFAMTLQRGSIPIALSVLGQGTVNTFLFRK